MMGDPPIRDAASLILVRKADGDPSVLMGRRGSRAAFMPAKFVCPGGATDPGDAQIGLATGLDPVCRDRLDAQGPPGWGRTLAVTAIRELWEETGLILGVSGRGGPDLSADWPGFTDAGFVPSAGGLRYVFRAITPPGRPRRFDARFFLADADRLASDPDDFSKATDELSDLQWVALKNIRALDLPFITEVVLAEVMTVLRRSGPPQSVPFFDNTTDCPKVSRIP